MKPNIRTSGNTYILTWAEEKVKIVMSRILEDSKSVSSEVVVYKINGKEEKHLYHARVNLLSTTSKKSIVRELELRDKDLPWVSILEEATIMSLREYRSGEPVMMVGNFIPMDTPLVYRLKPFVIEGALTSIFGYGGSLKSYIAILISLLICTGTSRLGLEPIKSNVLYLDWEATPDTMDMRVKAIKAGMDIDAPELPFYKRCSRTLAEECSGIQKEIIEKKVEVVIVDSVGLAAGLSENWQTSTGTFLTAIRGLGVSVLGIDHKSKDGKGMFGSVYKTNESRSTFEVKSRQIPGESSVDLGIFHRKVNDAPLCVPMGLKVQFFMSGDITTQVSFSKQDVSSVPDVAEGFSIRQRIKTLLLDSGAMTKEDIARALDVSEASVKTKLYQGKDDFVRMGNKWGILSEEVFI